MNDEYSTDGTGWARFSDDRTMRFRLGRSLDGRPLVVNAPGIVECDRCVTFLLLNPSDANAFENDPTVGRCAGFARALGADVYQIANIDALVSSDPQALYKCAAGFRGDDAVNDAEILAACQGAVRVVAAWGNDGALGGRDVFVRARLAEAGVTLHRLGVTDGGYPKHPLARGKHFIPLDRAPEVWA